MIKTKAEGFVPSAFSAIRDVLFWLNFFDFFPFVANGDRHFRLLLANKKNRNSDIASLFRLDEVMRQRTQCRLGYLIGRLLLTAG